MPASVPLLTRRTCWTLGTWAMMASASSISRSVGAPKLKPSSGGLLHRLEHGRVAVAQDHRAPGADVIDVALSFGVPHVGALRAFDETRRAAHGAEGAHR